MAKRMNCSVVLTSIAILLQIVFVVGLAIILQAGTSIPDLRIVLIDAHNYRTEVNGKTYVGLPDTNDFSRNKGFFTLYPGLYCSGNEVNGHFDADYCSSWGSQLFDLQRVWRLWGVDLVEQNVIGATPRIIFIGFMIAVSFAAIGLAFGLFTFYCSNWGVVLATTLSWLSTVFTIATAVLSHIFVDKLISSLAHLKVFGSGQVVATRGVWYDQAMWASCAVTFMASIFWTLVWWRNRRIRASKTPRSNGPIPLEVRSGLFSYKAEDTISYEHLVAERDVYHRGSVTSRESAYEPMRHHSLGY